MSAGRTTSSPVPLGIIAGSGELPRQVVQHCVETNRSVFAIAFEGITAAETVAGAPHAWVHIGKVGEILDTLKKHGAQEVLLAGSVGRPPISSLNMDFTALRLLLKLRQLSAQGDDQVFSTIIQFLEEQGMRVVGAESVLQELVIQEGPLGKHTPDALAQKDIALARKAAEAIGMLDIGQAVIVQQGQVLGVEGAEGTDRLISRCKEYHTEGPGGVLVKVQKPGQDARVDLPSIGTHTIENAVASKLRGIAVQAGGSLVINRAEVIRRADALGLFVIGI